MTETEKNKVDPESSFFHIYKKTWGREEWFINNEKYCGKLLVVKAGKWSSNGNFHYHKIKDETFYIIAGELVLDIEVDGAIRRILLIPGSSYRIKPEVKHRFTCSNSRMDCEFIEVSTTHRDDDSYRCYWDHNSQKWIDV